MNYENDMELSVVQCKTVDTCIVKESNISIESVKTVSANNKEKLCAGQEGTNISTSIA